MDKPTPVRVRTCYARPGMILAEAISGSRGRVLAGAGTVISQRILRVLKDSHVPFITVRAREDITPWELLVDASAEMQRVQKRFENVAQDNNQLMVRDAILHRIAVREQLLKDAAGDIED